MNVMYDYKCKRIVVIDPCFWCNDLIISLQKNDNELNSWHKLCAC